jgi:hypothetical protein
VYLEPVGVGMSSPSWGAVRVARVPTYCETQDGLLDPQDRAALVGAVLYYDDDAWDEGEARLADKPEGVDALAVCYLFRPLLSPCVILDLAALDEIPDDGYEANALATAIVMEATHPELARRIGYNSHVDPIGGRWSTTGAEA